VAAWIVPGTSYYGYGVVGGYPPQRQMPSGIRWSARQRARGAILKPTHGDQIYNLVVVIKLTAREGSAQAIGIWYTANGNNYYLQTSDAIVIKPKCF
jgi:hypothetical protein